MLADGICLNWRVGVGDNKGREKKGGSGNEESRVWYSALCPTHKKLSHVSLPQMDEHFDSMTLGQDIYRS